MVKTAPAPRGVQKNLEGTATFRNPRGSVAGRVVFASHEVRVVLAAGPRARAIVGLAAVERRAEPVAVELVVARIARVAVRVVHRYGARLHCSRATDVARARRPRVCARLLDGGARRSGCLGQEKPF